MSVNEHLIESHKAYCSFLQHVSQFKGFAVQHRSNFRKLLSVHLPDAFLGMNYWKRETLTNRRVNQILSSSACTFLSSFKTYLINIMRIALKKHEKTPNMSSASKVMLELSLQTSQHCLRSSGQIALLRKCCKTASQIWTTVSKTEPLGNLNPFGISMCQWQSDKTTWRVLAYCYQLQYVSRFKDCAAQHVRLHSATWYKRTPKIPE